MQDGCANFAGFSMTTNGLFGKYQFTIHRDFKSTAAGRNHGPATDKNFDFALTQNFVRQTDGTAGMMSNRAVFNLDVQKCELHEVILPKMYF